MHKGLTLVEMLVVIGMIAILTAASMAGYSKFIKQAEKAKDQELVSNVVTALSTIYQVDGQWPKRLVTGASGSDPKLDENAALPLGKRGYMTLNYDASENRLVGYDRFGVLTSDGIARMKNGGSSASRETVDKYVVRYGIDVDGDGITELPSLGVSVRATACAWCIGKNGKSNLKSLTKSWTEGQEVR